MDLTVEVQTTGPVDHRELMSTVGTPCRADSVKQRLLSYLPPKHCIKPITYLKKACLGKTEGIIKQRAEASEFDGNSGKRLMEEAQQEAYIFNRHPHHLFPSSHDTV